MVVGGVYIAVNHAYQLVFVYIVHDAIFQSQHFHIRPNIDPAFGVGGYVLHTWRHGGGVLLIGE
jgi:hypothetical protein